MNFISRLLCRYCCFDSYAFLLFEILKEFISLLVFMFPLMEIFSLFFARVLFGQLFLFYFEVVIMILRKSKTFVCFLPKTRLKMESPDVQD